MLIKKVNQPFLLIISGALIARVAASLDKSFWFDEAISWSFAKQDISQLLQATASDNHPPFYYLFLHFWLKLNQSEIFLRFPSIVFGLISVFLIYLIGKKLINEKVGISSAVLMALSPLHVYFSAETRMYSLWTLEIFVSFYFFLKILDHPKKNINYLLFNISFLLALYTHYFSLLFLLSLDLFLLQFSKYHRQLKMILFTQALAGLVFLPWLILVLNNQHPAPWQIPIWWGIPATFLSFILGGLGAATLKDFFAPSTSLTIKGFFAAVSLFFFALAILGFLRKTKEETKQIFFFLLIFPVLLTVLLSLAIPLYSPRSLIIFSPFFYLLVSLGLEKIKNPLRGWLKLATVTLLGIILLIQNFYPPFKPQTLKQAADFIKAQSLNPPVLHTDILTFYPFEYYLHAIPADQFLVFPSELNPKTTDILGGSPLSLSEIIKMGQPFWSVTFEWDEKTWKFKRELAGLKENFSCSLIKTINDLEINSCQPK